MIHCNKLKNIPTRVNIIGVPISVVNMESCISFLFSNWDAVHGNYVCVSNVHTTVMAHDDPQYYKVQAESLLSVPDGKPLSVIGRKKFPQMNRVTGPDLMRRLFEESKEKKIRHYFYLIHASSSAAFVGLDIVDGSYNGHFISHRFHQTGERYSLTGLLIEKILNLFKFRFR